MNIIFCTIIFILFVTATGLSCHYFVLKKKINALKEQQTAQEFFLTSLVHDLKTPTNSQAAALKLLKGGTFGSLTAEQAEIAELMSSSCEYMSNLIEIILKAYSDFGKIILKRTKFNVINLVEELCEETKSLRMEKNQAINIQKLSEHCIIYADRLQIRRVILNLLSNALAYGYSNTVINININVSENSFEFFVENVGKQIPKEELCRIFEKYCKARDSYYDNSEKGLGLFLVKQIIEKHKGRVYAKSNSDGICTFGFVIPNYLPADNKKGRPLLKKSAF